MAFDYNVGIKLAMATTGMEALGVISSKLLGIKLDAEATGKALDTMMLGLKGAAAVALGAGTFEIGKRLVEHGMELVHQQALFQEQLRKMPEMTPEKLAKETAEATAQAWKTAGEVVTTTAAENMKSIRELITVFGGLKEAEQYLTGISQAAAVMNSVLGKGAGDQVFDMAKALEMMGVSQDPVEFMKRLDLMVKAANASGGRVLGSDFLSAAKYGRTATQGWDDEFIGQILPTLIQEMKSHGGSGGRGGPGNALMSAFQVVVGGVMSNKGAEEFYHLGLLDPNEVIHTRTGAVKGVEPGGVRGAAEFQADPYKWVQEYLVPALRHAGITDPNAVREEIAHLFAGRTSQQIMTMFATQQTRFEKDAALNRGASGTGAYGTLVQNDPVTQMKAFHQAWENLMTALGAPIVGDATGMMKHLGDAITWIAEAAANHPKVTEDVELFVGAIAGLAVVGGSLALISAGLSGLGLALAPFAAGAGAVAALATLGGGIAVVGSLAALGVALVGLAAVVMGLFKKTSVAGERAQELKRSHELGLPKAVTGPSGLTQEQQELVRHGLTREQAIQAAPSPYIQKESYVPGARPDDGARLWDIAYRAGQDNTAQRMIRVYVDGRSLFDIMLDRLGDKMELPPSGTPSPDPRMTPIYQATWAST